MNLSKLFKIQKQLDERIVKEKGLEGQDLLDKKILALQVELGELAQNWRGFKYWSNDQDPRIKDYKQMRCKWCNGSGDDGTGVCPDCRSSGDVYKEYNQLLEEYVDCLHFILSIGLDLNVRTPYIIGDYMAPDVTKQFKFVFEDISRLDRAIRNEYGEDIIFDIYDDMVRGLLGLGKMLGFAWEQIEQSYLDKNKINHERLESGY